MNLNDIVGGLKQMNNPVAQNAIEKFTKGDINGVNQIAENLMQANAGDPRVQKMMDCYRSGDINGLISLLRR